MAAKDPIKLQILRLSGLPFYPSEDMAVKILVDTLRGATVSNEHAEATIDEILDGFERCPVPKDIRRTAFELRPERRESVTAHCGMCNGSGFVTRQVGIYSGAVECECRRKPAEVAS